MKRNRSFGFTLFELLVVLGVLSSITGALLLAVKPNQAIKKARDVARVNDINNLKSYFVPAISEDPDLTIGNANTIYISLPDTTTSCTSWTANLPGLPTNWQYNCVTTANLRKNDGTGWLPINFSSLKLLRAPSLPVDPVNNESYYYAYVTDSTSSYMVWVLPAINRRQSKLDGDVPPQLYSQGNNQTLLNTAQGLIGYWPLEEGTSTVTLDLSGNANTGTAYNGSSTICASASVASTCPQWVSGKIGKAFQFDGGDDYIDVGSSTSLNVPGGITIVLWVNVNTNTTTNDFFGNYDYTASNAQYAVEMLTSGQPKFVIANSGSYEIYTASTNLIPSGQWVHYVVTNDGSDNVKIYINGESKQVSKSGSVTTPTTSPADTFIGTSDRVNSDNTHGKIDEVRLYNRVLTADEIKALYEATNE